MFAFRTNVRYNIIYGKLCIPSERKQATTIKEVLIVYMCIDLKSFFASVECVERGLDPMKVNLVVADVTRTEKTICLAVSPAMKRQGVKNRCRVFEIPKNIEYITAPPRMRLYIEYASRIYSIYLKYFSKYDIHVYSIDEVFIDMTNYMNKNFIYRIYMYIL